MPQNRRIRAFALTGPFVVATLLAALLATAGFYYQRACLRAELVRVGAQVADPARRPANHATMWPTPRQSYCAHASSRYWAAVFPAFMLRDELDTEMETPPPASAYAHTSARPLFGGMQSR